MDQEMKAKKRRPRSHAKAASSKKITSVLRRCAAALAGEEREGLGGTYSPHQKLLKEIRRILQKEML